MEQEKEVKIIYYRVTGFKHRADCNIEKKDFQYARKIYERNGFKVQIISEKSRIY